MLLTPKQARSAYAYAMQERFAVLAVNADSPAAIMDVLEAAWSCDAPIIIETSLWQLQGRSFGGGDPFLGMHRFLADLVVLGNSDRYRDVPILFHTDHIKGPFTIDLLKTAITGFRFVHDESSLRLSPSSISLDASEFTDEQNVESICLLAEHARSEGREIVIEMETPIDDRITTEEETRALVEAVEKRCPGTISVFAPGLGTSHGFVDDAGYPEFSVDNVKKQAALLGSITGRPVGLALHGSSGLSADALKAAAANGVVKVNWSSEALHARSTAARDYYATLTEKFDRSHPDWKATVMDNGVQSYVAERFIPVVEERIRMLGGGGRGSAFFRALRDPDSRLATAMNH